MKFVIQICPYDCRHTINTICRAARHAKENEDSPSIEILVYEDNVEGLARHVLLLAVLLDASLTIRERAEIFLEIHGNILVQDKTEEYIGTGHHK